MQDVLQNAFISVAGFLFVLLYIYILFQRGGFHGDGTEEPFWVPRRTFQEKVLKRTNFVLVWQTLLWSEEPFSAIKNREMFLGC